MSTPEIEFYVEGRPAPQGSKIATAGGGLREQSPYLSKWRQDVKRACLRHLKDALKVPPRELPLYRKGVPVLFIVTFYVLTDPVEPPDWDKLGRATGDALTDAHAWADDGQVTDAFVRIRPADENHPQGAFIHIREAVL